MCAYADETKEKLKQSIAKKISNGERFSISFDEYTSPTNKRYLCLNLHDENHETISLGMIAIAGSLPAEKALKLIDIRLSSFGLNRKRHIVGAVTDGASMMKKLVRLMEIEHQLCHAHGTHLAVTDLIYKAKINMEEEEEEEVVVVEEVVEEEENEDELAKDESLEADDDDLEEDFFIEEMEYLEQDFEDDIEPLVKKVRKIVKLFRKSPVKNSTLQTYVVELNPTKEPLQLILDVKTR